MFPPLYSWNRQYWPKAAIVFLLSSLSCGILGFLAVLSLEIYLRFFIFTVTSCIFHYQRTIGMISIIAGCLGFLASMQSQV